MAGEGTEPPSNPTLSTALGSGSCLQLHFQSATLTQLNAKNSNQTHQSWVLKIQIKGQLTFPALLCPVVALERHGTAGYERKHREKSAAEQRRCVCAGLAWPPPQGKQIWASSEPDTVGDGSTLPGLPTDPEDERQQENPKWWVAAAPSLPCVAQTALQTGISNFLTCWTQVNHQLATYL